MTLERRIPAPGAPHADMFPRATLVACGQVPGLGAATTPPDLPAYQALDPWGQPDAGLPWFHIGGPTIAPAATTTVLTLAEILGGTQWLLLAVGPGHDSLALALALASWARARGIRIAAIRARASATPALPSRALEEAVHYVCACPPGLEALGAARALALGAAAAWRAGDGNMRPLELLRGSGGALWLPDGATPAAWATAGTGVGTPGITFAVQVGLAGAAGVTAGPALPAGGIALRQGLPATPGLAAGTYLFHA